TRHRSEHRDAVAVAMAGTQRARAARRRRAGWRTVAAAGPALVHPRGPAGFRRAGARPRWGRSGSRATALPARLTHGWRLYPVPDLPAGLDPRLGKRSRARLAGATVAPCAGCDRPPASRAARP